MKSWINVLFAIAALWGVLAGLIIAIVPFGMGVSVEVNSEGTETTSVSRVGFFETQGWWGFFILVVFAALYYGPLHFYRRSNVSLAAIFAIVAITISYLAGMSIGTLYFPGALCLLAGLVLMPFSKQKRPD